MGNQLIGKPPLGSRPSQDWIQSTGCVGLWLMNEGGGGKIYDLSDNNNHGTLTNMSIPATATSGWTGGKFGSALAFNGTNNYVSVADNANQDTEGLLTVSTWFKIPNGVSVSHCPLVMHDNSNYKYLLTVRATIGDLEFYVRTVSGVSIGSYAQANGYFSDNKWHHIVGVYNKSLSSARIKIYLDGMLVGTGNGYNENITAGDEGIYIGTWSGSYINGFIDNVYIYNKALPESEIKCQFATPFYMFPKRSPVLYFIPAGGEVYRSFTSNVEYGLNTSVQKIFPISSQLNVIKSAQELIENQSRVMNNKQLSLEWNSRIIIGKQFFIDSLLIIKDSLLFQIEDLLSVISNRQILTDSLLETVSDNQIPVDNQLRVLQPIIINIDLLQRVINGKTLQIDNVSRILSNKQILIEDLLRIISDDQILIDNQLRILQSVTNLLDHLLLIKENVILPIEWGSTVVWVIRDVLLPIEFQGQIIKSGINNIYWQNRILNSKIFPIELLSRIMNDKISVFEYSKEVISGKIIRIESLKDVITNKVLPIEWVLYVPGNAIHKDVIIPIEFGNIVRYEINILIDFLGNIEPIRIVNVTTETLYGIGVITNNRYEITLNTENRYEIIVDTKYSLRRN